MKECLSSFVSIIFMSVVMSACGSEPLQQSQPHVVNGQDLALSSWPSTVKLNVDRGRFLTLCTGTFVNSYQVVTAAHCVHEMPADKIFVKVRGRRVYANQVVSQPGYDLSYNNGVNSLDLAVVNFARGTSRHWTLLSEKTLIPGQFFTIVGFGNNNNATESGSGFKRVGTNTLSAVGDMLRFAGDIESRRRDGRRASTGQGDSGGPLFVEGRLAGVTSGGGVYQGRSNSAFVNVQSPLSKRFLKRHVRSQEWLDFGQLWFAHSNNGPEEQGKNVFIKVAASKSVQLEVGINDYDQLLVPSQKAKELSFQRIFYTDGERSLQVRAFHEGTLVAQRSFDFRIQ